MEMVFEFFMGDLELIYFFYSVFYFPFIIWTFSVYLTSLFAAAFSISFLYFL